MSTVTTSLAPRIPVHVEITSDSICPFCVIGFKRIQKAIAHCKAKDLPLDFSISFAPFLLDPTMPESPGENKRERYERRFGGKEKVAAMEAAMIERGKGEGVNFSYGGNVSQTTDSHRLILKARLVGGEKTQLDLVERLFKSYFEEEKDPGEWKGLAKDSVDAGVFTNEEEALTFLKSNDLKKEVQEGIVKAQQRGISGVPFTILNEKLAISGAQETATFIEVFEKLASGELKA